MQYRVIDFSYRKFNDENSLCEYKNQTKHFNFLIRLFHCHFYSGFFFVTDFLFPVSIWSIFVLLLRSIPILLTSIIEGIRRKVKKKLNKLFNKNEKKKEQWVCIYKKKKGCCKGENDDKMTRARTILFIYFIFAPKAKWHSTISTKNEKTNQKKRWTNEPKDTVFTK